MGLLSKLFGPPPRVETKEMGLEFSAAAMDLVQNFHQCTELERRGLYAMQCRTIFGRRALADGGFGLACAALSHAWWIVGLALQQDRQPELMRAIKHQTWREHMGTAEGAAELADWAASRGPATDEEKVAAFATDLWARLGLPPRDMPDPRYRPLSRR